MEYTPYGRFKELDALVDSRNVDDRLSAALQGYGLEILVNDEDAEVRAAVAHQGYGLEQLVNDDEIIIRIEVAAQGFGHNKLIRDDEKEVRASVATNLCEKINVLLNDKDEYVRSHTQREVKRLITPCLVKQFSERDK